MIHRTGLTQESTEALLLAADVLKLVIDAAREQLDALMQSKIKGMYKYVIWINFDGGDKIFIK